MESKFLLSPCQVLTVEKSSFSLYTQEKHLSLSSIHKWPRLNAAMTSQKLFFLCGSTFKTKWTSSCWAKIILCERKLLVSWLASASQLHHWLTNSTHTFRESLEFHTVLKHQSEYLVKPGEFQVLTDSRPKDFPCKIENKNIWLSLLLKWSIPKAFDEKIWLYGTTFFLLIYPLLQWPHIINRSEDNKV